MHVARQEDALADQEDQCHAQAAEYFEVDPEILISERHVQVRGAAEQEKDDPGDVQLGPYRLGQAQCMAHDALDQQPVTDEMAPGKDQGKQPVDHGCFPLEERLAVKSQRQATEHKAGNECQPLTLFQFALGDEQDAVDDYRADDQHRGGAENTAYHEAMAQDIDRARLDLVNDEKQEQRDEVDELFHNGSQKQDVAA